MSQDDGRVVIDDPLLANEIAAISVALRDQGFIGGELVSDNAARWLRQNCWNCRCPRLACQCIFP